MRVLFVYSDLFPSHQDWTGHYYVGLGSLSAVLKKAGHNTAMIHVTHKFSKKELFLGKVRSYDPQLIAFSCTTLTFSYVCEMAEWLKSAGINAPIISGGIHSTLEPMEVVTTPHIDMACVGEGEYSLLSLVEALEKENDYNNLPGIWVNENGKIYENGTSPTVGNLDNLPFPDRSIFDYPNMEHERNGKAIFMASRGCPYPCSYCSNEILQKTLYPEKPGDYIRFRSVDNVIVEIKETIAEYPFIRYAHFDDDLFFLKKPWAREFAEKYSKEIGLPFTCNMRPNHLKPEIAKLLKKAGCMEVKIGLESGNDWIRNTILKRKLSNRVMVESFKNCSDAGLKTHSFNMVGIPYETSETVLDTIKMNAKIRADLMQVSVFYPLPKTALYDLCKEKGFTPDEERGYDFFSPHLNIGTLSRRKISFFLKNFKIFVSFYSVAYKLPPPVSKVAELLLDSLLKTYFMDILSFALSQLRKVKSFFKHRCRMIFNTVQRACH